MERSIIEFAARFGGKPALVAGAPGRVNILGEHVDYNDGLVLPMAINRRIYAAGSLNDSGRARIVALDHDSESDFHLSGLEKRGEWDDYVKGVIEQFQKQGANIPGLDAVICGDVPEGSGLSSSAALEVSVAALLDRLLGTRMTLNHLALLCQRAENEFVGVRCGIMDQFACALSKAGNLLLLDCRTLEIKHLPFHAKGVKIAIFDTRAPRSLAASAYNQRREECERALHIIQKRAEGITSLRDVSEDLLESCRHDLPDPLYSRALHVVTEIGRVEAATKILQSGYLVSLGRLLDASHESLRDLYEVSSRELETARELALRLPGVLGGRLTGAGFGGCLVFLVKDQAVDNFTQKMCMSYRSDVGVVPEIYITGPEHGVSVFQP